MTPPSSVADLLLVKSFQDRIQEHLPKQLLNFVMSSLFYTKMKRFSFSTTLKLLVSQFFYAGSQRTVFAFTPISAPYKATVFPLLQRAELDAPATAIAARLRAAGLSTKIDTTSACPLHTMAPNLK